jgi:hypothetical protein
MTDIIMVALMSAAVYLAIHAGMFLVNTLY